jgi:uncharacterized membrane protein
MQTAMSQPRDARKTAAEMAHTQLMTGVALIAIAGVAVSSVSLYEHFATSKTSFCNFSESFNCDLVNRSEYSTVLGMPVALIGVFGYLLIAVLATVYRKHAETPVLLLIASGVGLGFALYLAYVEKFKLGVWCILCLASLGLICGEAILSASVIFRTKNHRNA